jgi:sugar/nucleoside kinase (ribokinase family)
VHFADTFLLPLLDGGPAAELLKQLKGADVTTSVDVAWDPHARWGSLISSYFPFVDFLFCNRSEAEMLTGFADPNDAARFLLDQGVKCVIVKMGSAGSKICRSTSVLDIPAIPTEVLDTTGAGDSYAAGLLVGVLKGWDDYKIGGFASAAAAASIRSLGATSGIVSFADTLSLANLSDPSRFGVEINGQ